MARRITLAAALAGVLAALAACGGGGGPAGTTAAPTTATTSAAASTAATTPDGTAITLLVLQWYRDADPAVCDRMTDNLLEYGWSAKGDAGRKACREAVGAAQPVTDIEVAEPAVSGDTARVSISYALDGKQQTNQLTFVRGPSGWLVDTVERAG